MRRGTEDELRSLLQCLGEEARRVDLPDAACRHVRQETARLIAERSPIPRRLWVVEAGPRLAWAATLLILLTGAGAMLITLRLPARRRAAAAADAALDAEIVELQRNIAGDVWRFRERHAQAGRFGAVEARTRLLRTRIELCAVVVRTELQGATDTDPGHLRPGSDVNDAEEDTMGPEETYHDKDRDYDWKDAVVPGDCSAVAWVLSVSVVRA